MANQNKNQNKKDCPRCRQFKATARLRLGNVDTKICFGCALDILTSPVRTVSVTHANTWYARIKQ